MTAQRTHRTCNAAAFAVLHALFALWPCVGLAGCSAADRNALLLCVPAPPSSLERPATPIIYWHETRTMPRPLRVHGLRVDLQSPRLEPLALIAPDPDGAGAAEARLEYPLALATQQAVIAAVNASRFWPVPAPPQGESPHWTNGLPVDILGAAWNRERHVSPPQTNVWSFWIDAGGRGQIAREEVPGARMAVGGHHLLLTNGGACVHEDGVLHPRTALGLQRDGCTLWLVVVDGRQPGFSEGMSCREMAEFMQRLGCWDAMNLDGGGSSCLLLDADGTGLRVMNQPSDKGTRPVPVMLGFRRAPPK